IIGATLGFKSMKTAYATIKGIEVMRALRKGQGEHEKPRGSHRMMPSTGVKITTIIS
ncbi:hypothetical protein PGO67_25195, partial [Klebsiella aerogenes]